jgi:hypothetical protein
VKRSFLFSFFLLLSISLQALAAPPEKPYDHSTWDQFLKKYVNEEGDINYTAVKQDPALLNQYLDQLRQLPWYTLREWPREELMALWINAYHAGLVKNVLKYYPIKNVHEAPGFWEEDVLNVGQRFFSLNEVRTYYLLGAYRDSKIHTYLSYAAKSGPVLSRDALTGPTVEGKLFQAARRFANDSIRNQIKPGEKNIRISKIFEWFPRDFNTSFGVFENDRGLSVDDFAVLSFLAYYLEDDEKVRYLEDEKYKIKYLPFDWSLNDWKTAA